MQKLYSLIVGLLISGFLSAQSVSPEVISTAGDYFSNSNASISWTMSELVTETFTNGNTILTQGFQQSYSIAITGINLNSTVFLEGPFNGIDMNTDSNSQGILPLSQPFNISPWNYSGSENVIGIPTNNVVDWVLVEIRDAADAASANSSTIVEQQAAFLLNNGSVVGLDGSSFLSFNHSIIHSLYLVIHHRNHLSVMSANAVNHTGGNYVYDFSTNMNMAYQSGEKLIGGKAVIYGGDANADGTLDLNDKLVWNYEAGTSGYLNSDASLDGQSDNKDKDDIWLPNNETNTQVPE
jgi:hypothetical protein